MRFIIEGQGGFTAVHGRRIKMQRGDVILTPTWNWHDHGKDGDGPMIWLDGLDLPNFMHFPVHFVEHYDQPRYPAEDVDVNASPIVFPWTEMKATLDRNIGNEMWTMAPYLKKDGREGKFYFESWLMRDYLRFSNPVSKVLGGRAERLNAGGSSPRVRETVSSVYHVIEGSGYSSISGLKLVWNAGDTFCIPAWCEYQHFANADEHVYLYRFDDGPMLKALGFYRTIDMDKDSLVSD